MKQYVLTIVAITATALFAIGCDSLTGEKPDSPVVATIDKSHISTNDYIKEISRVPEWARPQFKEVEGKKKFLDELVKRELIYQQALKMKLDKSNEYTEKLEEFEKATLVSLILKKEVEEKATINDEEVRNFYDQNAEKFTIGTKIKASHILVKTEEEAKNIMERINKGEKFGNLAKELSLDKMSAEKGGDLGYFGRGKMVPEFEMAALALNPGEVSDPVRSRFGYHVIKLADIKKGEAASFEQSRESIMKQLMSEKRKELFDSYIAGLESASTIVKDDFALENLALPWEDQGVNSIE